MSLTRTTSRPPTWVAGLLLAGVAAVVLPARAETSPYWLGASLALTHDSNLDRAPAGLPGQPIRSDTDLATGLRLGLDQPFGRQRVQASAELNHHQYRRYGQYDHDDHLLQTRLDWSSAELWSGNVQAETRQLLDRTDVNASTTLAGRSLVRSDRLGTTVRLGGPTRYTFDAGLSGAQLRYDTVTSRNVRQLTGSGGVTVRPGNGLRLRAGLRHTRADYPNYSVAGVSGDRVGRDDADFSTVVEASGASTLNARLSRTRESHSAQLGRDYSAWTGSAGWTWKPSARLAFDTTLSRDSNVGSTAFESTTFSYDTSDTRLRTSLALRASWELTSKIVLTGGTSLSRRTLDNALTTGGGTAVTTASDRTVGWDLAVRYLPVRNVELACGLSRESRGVSDPNVTITYAYAVTVASCSGQLFWR